ncbi:glycosyl hydrolases family 18-domain-containing protein [Chytriomyces sp. MP71]|nr:glycosyl hydrolases family 18-domain-containing protein [Chytriomyces sp. MP71]
MLPLTALAAFAGVFSLVSAVPVTRGQSSNRIIGYHESWYWYDSPGNLPFKFTADQFSRYTHINYAFATVAFHSKTQQFYVGFTDAYADYQACVSLNGAAACPSQCIPVPAAKQCTGGKVAMVPYIGANGTCPDSACYNPSGAPGSPRVPKCEAVLDANSIQTDANGNPVICGNYAYVLNNVKKNGGQNLKYLISIGGWYDSNLFSAATEPQYIDGFVKSIVEFVKFFGFDGVDFDWEYPGWEHGNQAPFNGGSPGTGTAEDMTDCSKATCAYPQRQNDMAKFNALVSKVRAALGSNYLISMAAPAGADKMNKLDIKTICQNLDYVNIMAYDIHGEWETNTNHQAALYDDTPNQFKSTNGVPETSVDFAVNYFINNGCPANQVVVGVPFYAHAWKLNGYTDKGEHGLFVGGASASTVTKLNYVDISADKSIATYWDATAQASYGYSSSQQTFYSFDTAQAISAKVGYGAQKGLGGFMVWPMDGDDANATLLKALTGAGTNPSPSPPSSSAAPATSSVKPSTSSAAPSPSTAKPTTTVSVTPASSSAVKSSTKASSSVVPPSSSSSPVGSSSVAPTSSVAKTTSRTTVVAPTTSAGGSSVKDGAACATFGQWACNYGCICNYATAGLIWQCNPSGTAC